MEELHILGQEKRDEDKKALSNYKVKMVMIENLILRNEYRKMEKEAIKYAAIAVVSLILNLVALWALRG